MDQAFAPLPPVATPEQIAEVRELSKRLGIGIFIGPKLPAAQCEENLKLLRRLATLQTEAMLPTTQPG